MIYLLELFEHHLRIYLSEKKYFKNPFSKTKLMENHQSQLLRKEVL